MVVAAQLFMLTHRLQTLGNAGVSAAGTWRSDGLGVAPLRTDSPAQRGSLQAAADMEVCVCVCVCVCSTYAPRETDYR
jgi:hypothetical protein